MNIVNELLLLILRLVVGKKVYTVYSSTENYTRPQANKVNPTNTVVEEMSITYQEQKSGINILYISIIGLFLVLVLLTFIYRYITRKFQARSITDDTKKKDEIQLIEKKKKDKKANVLFSEEKNETMLFLAKDERNLSVQITNNEDHVIINLS